MSTLILLAFFSFFFAGPGPLEGFDTQSLSSVRPRRPADEGWSLVGVYLGDMTADRARDLALPEISGVIVGKVEDGSPAAIAGILPNDCILTIDGARISNRLQFFQVLMDTSPGSLIRLGLLRAGERLDIGLKTGFRPSPALLQRRRLFSEADSMLRMAEESRRLAEESLAKGDQATAARHRETEATFRQMSEDNRAYIENELREGRISEPIAVQNLNLNVRLASTRYALGLTLVRLTPQLAAFFRVEDGGLLVSEVRAGSLAETSGIRAGDCLVRFNNLPLKTPTEFSQSVDRMVVATTQGGQPEFILTLIRDGGTRTVSLKF
ncbi:MAG: PDZ domain-containing protein [Acidobacteria bacterium]|nr:PDZ domain-containing protein [Acidobacteriota bacterium]